jgi:predicted alpha/beta superfamily hydrolase
MRPTLIIIFIAAPFLLRSQNKPDSIFSLGIVDKLYSAELKENRILNIYLPEGYKAGDTTKYPVVYLLDGGVDEDFIHIAGLYQFNNFSWINRVPKSIVVGIANTDRKRDFTFPSSVAEEKKKYPSTGHSDKFIAFIEKELQPFIEKKYKTTENKTIIGQSLGGLLATEILFKKPQLFSKYVIVSPSLWWDNGSLLNCQPGFLKENFTRDLRVYIGVGKEGLTPTASPRVMEVDANLLADKIRSTRSKSVKVFFDYLPEEDHATISHQAVFNALRMLHPVQGK